MTAQPPPAPRPLAARERVLAGDLYRRELVGLYAQIVRSCNPGIVGAAGRVVGETMNMLVLQARRPPGGRRGGRRCRGGPDPAPPRPRPRPCRSYPKAGSVWRFRAAPAPAPSPAPAGGSGGQGAEAWAVAYADLDGSAIARRPEDRLRSRAPAAPVEGGQGGGAA